MRTIVACHSEPFYQRASMTSPTINYVHDRHATPRFSCHARHEPLRQRIDYSRATTFIRPRSSKPFDVAIPVRAKLFASITTDRARHAPQIEMHKEGHILLKGNLIDPVGGQIYRMLFKIGQLIRPSKSAFLQQGTDECLVLKELLQEKSDDVIKILSESHWTSSCVITLHKLESICGESDEASIILSYLVQCGTGQYFSIKKGDFIQGVKVSLVSSSVPPLRNVDFEILHLISTMEKMQKQLDVIDQRWELSRKSALAAFTSGNKPAAYRHIRCTKLLANSRDNYASLLDRVEEVLGIISQSETTKMVAEAIQTGARVIRNQQISVDQVHQCLEELDEISASQKLVDETLGSASIESADVEYECLEEDFKKLQLELLGEKTPLQVKDDAIPSRDIAPEATLIMESASSLADTFSHLQLTAA